MMKMTMIQKYKELQWLAQEIKRHDELYYADNNNSADDSAIKV
jgi:NAD-dependent DNA ligase